MCGITGYKTLSKRTPELKNSLENAVQSLRFRGPDNQATFFDKSVGLGHTRLSIIDTSDHAHQPMTDRSGRYTLIFNGEIYNFKSLRKEIYASLISESDTEVLLYLLIKEGENCLSKLNGFFAFAFYDSQEETLLLARDRMGIKPLHYFISEDFFAFGSELKALLSFPIPRKLNHKALYWYLRLTYLPGEMSMIQGIRKLLPGHYMKIIGDQINIDPFWSLEEPQPYTGNYQDAKKEVVRLLEQSVQKRMVADVPLGAFLSGGTDSSAVVSMASKFDANLNTFSIGYKDHPFFDETRYAELVAKKFKTNHTTFSLTNDDLLGSLDDVVNYIDEPFADSSAIPTYILSKHVSKHMTVALSGDGADELFGGYYKHLAFNNAVKKSGLNNILQTISPVIGKLPQSRSTRLGNLMRRIVKYAELQKLSALEKYWLLASFNPNPNNLLISAIEETSIAEIESSFGMGDPKDINDFLDMDLQVVLPGDMLTKVDLMSMANSLEVRVPFLDKDMVSFARSLPGDFKVSGNQRKRVLQDAFENILPNELHHRSKKGFEVPMLSWMRNELNTSIDEVVFNAEFLKEQGLFNPSKVMELKRKLFSSNPGDVHAIIWALFVFQKWYKKFMDL